MRNVMALHREHASYDRSNDVIWVDVTGVVAESRRDIDAIFDPIISMAKLYPDRYIITCWKDVKMADPVVADHYGKRSVELLDLCRGIVRYAATDPLTRANIRTEVIKHRANGLRWNLYESRESALAAVQEMRRRGAPPSSKDPGR
jgi:hypothetical protein